MFLLILAYLIVGIIVVALLIQWIYLISQGNDEATFILVVAGFILITWAIWYLLSYYHLIGSFTTPMTKIQ
jgi:hypothetical protein